MQVVLRKHAENIILVVGCVHIISGSAKVQGEIHALPGKPEAQQRFKRQIVINVLEQLKDTAQGLSRPGASQGGGARAAGFILVGDFNLLPKSMDKAVSDNANVFNGLEQACLAARHVGRPGPEQRDWAVTNWQVAQPDVPLVVSNDRAHASVVVDIARPAATPRQIMSRVDHMRQRLSLRIGQRAKSKEEQDRSDEDVQLKSDEKRLKVEPANKQTSSEELFAALKAAFERIDANTKKVLSPIL